MLDFVDIGDGDYLSTKHITMIYRRESFGDYIRIKKLIKKRNLKYEILTRRRGISRNVLPPGWHAAILVGDLIIMTHLDPAEIVRRASEQAIKILARSPHQRYKIQNTDCVWGKIVIKNPKH